MRCPKSCDDCITNDNITQRCETCGIREYVFDKDPVRSFLNLCLDPFPKNSPLGQKICIAHNAKSFDAQFLLRELVIMKQCYPTVILKGKNIILLECNSVKFIDSLSYFQCKLADLPRTFSLPETTKKGYFPHLFNTKTNVGYKGQLPDKLYYDSDSMSTKEREKFLKWYEETRSKNYHFNFNEELISYCKSDVQVLRQACIKFRKLFIEHGKVDPFLESCIFMFSCLSQKFF